MSVVESFGPPASSGTPLSLRVRGGPRDGQLVKLNAARCTIGSSRGCTLRLHGKDVRPVHCLIVRGKANAVVRRWSADTLVNGESFDDRPLTLGDRLRCGPVEFEIVHESGESIRPQPSGGEGVARQSADPQATQFISNRGGFAPSAANPPMHDRAASDAPTMTVAMSQVRPLPTPNADANASTDSAVETARTALAEREREIASREVECAHQERTLAERDADLARRQSQLDAREEQLGQREQQVESRAVAAPADGDSSPSDATELDETRQKLEEDREKVERAQRELDAQHAMRAAEHARWQEDHRQWKAQRQAADNQMEGIQAQVEHQLAEILSRRKNLDHDRDTWTAESEQHRRQLDERAAEVARQAEELEKWRSELDGERQKAASLIEETSRHEQLCSELADARSQLAEREGEIAAARKEIERFKSEAARWKSDAAAAQNAGASVDSDESDVGIDRATLERQAHELLQARRQLELERAEFEARVGNDAVAGEPHRVQTGGEPASPIASVPMNGQIDFADDEDADEDAAAETTSYSPPQSSTSYAPSADGVPGDDGDSIERYMANLLDRVGGRSTDSQTAAPESPAPPPSPAAPTSSSSAREATRSSPNEKPVVPAEKPDRPEQRATKTVTPEEVAAMRELANLNTRVAINKHGSRRMIPNIMGKATLSVLAFAAAAGLFLFAHTSRDVRYLGGAAASALLGAMFFARTITTVGRLFTSHRRGKE